MELTIHYKLTTDRTEVESIRDLVRDIRQLALQLPFQAVEDFVEFERAQCQYDDQDDPQRWLKIQAGRYLEHENCSYRVISLHIIAFTTVPGDGSEPANIGFARFADAVQIERAGRKQQLRTNMPGWSWGSFCKTQYASDPECGGVANFVRCHLCVVNLLDAMQKRRLVTVKVNDESDYWDHRDLRKLAETVGEWNQMIAAIAGQFKDALSGVEVQAPITTFPDFEHLEAKGQEKLNKHTS